MHTTASFVLIFWLLLHHHCTAPSAPQGKAIRAELAKRTERTSVPNVFIAGKSVGGCNDGPGVATLQGKGELVPLLQAAGAL